MDIKTVIDGIVTIVMTWPIWIIPAFIIIAALTVGMAMAAGFVEKIRNRFSR